MIQAEKAEAKKIAIRNESAVLAAPVLPQAENATEEEKIKEQNRFLEDTRRAVLNILEDVSDSEHELRRKSLDLEKFKQAADVSFDHIVITDADGVILYANRAAEEVTGFSQTEIVGKNPGKMWGGQMSQGFYEIFWRTIKTDKVPYSGEITNKRKNGKKYLASIRVSPILNVQGEVKFFVGVERDITDEREAQLRVVKHAAELQEANVLIEKQKERSEGILSFLRSIGDGVIATDTSGKIIFFNEAAEKIVGVADDESMNKDATDVLFAYDEKNPDKRIFIVKSTLDGSFDAKKHSTHFFVLKKDGVRVPVDFSASLIFDARGEKQGCIVVMRDVTEQRELERAKDSFLSVAAHQLRTPLSGMRWSLEMLLDGDAGELPAEAVETVKNINDNNQRLVALVNDLLNVSRINMGKVIEPAKATGVAETVQSVIKSCQAFADKNKVDLVFEKGKDLAAQVMISPQRFFEAIENVINNGIKYTPEQGRVEISIQNNQNKMELVVKDSGIGIPEREKEKIFTKFFRAENAIKKEPEGSGLGLSVVKSFIEEAKGSVAFESAEGKGTSFFINLPEYKKNG